MKNTRGRSMTCYLLSITGLAWLGAAATAFAETAYIPSTHSTLDPPNFESHISVVDTASGKVLRRIDTPIGMSAVAITPDGTSAYVLSEEPNVITVIDTARRVVRTIIPDVTEPVDIAIAPDGSKAYVVSLDAGISVIDTATNTVAKFIRIDCTGVTFSPDGTTAYAMGRQGHVFVIDTAADTVVSKFNISGLSVVGKPTFSPDGSRFYVPNIQFKVIQVVDSGTHKLLSPIRVPKGVDSLAIGPDGTGYALNRNGAAMTVVDLVKGKPSATVDVGNDATSINFAAHGGTAFVTTPKGVVVIHTATNTVAKKIDIGETVIAGGSFIAPPISPLAATVLPAARSVALGATAVVKATLANNRMKPLTCGVEVLAPSAAALELSYRPTDTGGAATGPIGKTVTIAAHSTQDFNVILTSKAAQAVTALPLLFDCDGVTRAPTAPGLNTLDLAFSADKTADVIARTAADTVTVPVNGNGRFTVATNNAGGPQALTVSADDGDALLPIALTLCPSDQSTHACLSAPGKSVSVPFAAGANRTFSVFVHAADYIPLDANNSRIFVRFRDTTGASRGLASIAIKTEAIDPKNPPIPGPVYSASFSATGSPRTQFCTYGTSYSGTATVRLNPGSVTGKVNITGTEKVTLVSNTSGGSQICTQTHSLPLNASGDIVLSGGKIEWMTSSVGAYDGSLVSNLGAFRGTITTSRIAGTLTERDPIIGTTILPLTLPVKH